MNLNARQNKDITIYRITSSGGVINPTGIEVATVPITAAARRTFHLMSEDSITLVFSLDEQLQFLPGDYIRDELFGLFEIAEEQVGVWNKSTGGYDHNIKFVRQYWRWNNHVLMLTRKENTTNTYRAEAKWQMTGMLEEHVSVVLDNVRKIGYATHVINPTFGSDITAERKDEVHFLAYDGMRICDALTAIADEYECEWWVTENGGTTTIHFGKCETAGEPLLLRPGYEAETLSVTRNQSIYANRILALGSDKNIPSYYGKTLGQLTTFTVTEVLSDGTSPEPLDVDTDDDGIPYDVMPAPTQYSKRFRDANHPLQADMAYRNKVTVTFDGISTQYVARIDGAGYLYINSSTSIGNISDKAFTLDIYDPEAMPVMLSGLLLNKIPAAWFATSDEDPSSVISIGERRLMLPKNTPSWWEQLCAGYEIDSKRRWVQKVGQTEHQSVEQTVIYGNIYPRCYLKVTSVTATPETQKSEYEDGSVAMWKWTRYVIEAVQYPSGNAFKFSAAYVDGELKANFCSEMEEIEACNQSSTAWVDHEGRLLAGMTFNLGFRIKDGHYYFELCRNQDYGAMLPNDTLKPSVGDVFTLTGWDVRSMGMTGIIESAEDTLAYCAAEYLKAMEEGQFVFRLGMMSDWPFTMSQSGYWLPDTGQRITVPIGAQGVKTSRLIGYELKLDYPYDSAQLEVGETDAYSRLKRMERMIAGKGGGCPMWQMPAPTGTDTFTPEYSTIAKKYITMDGTEAGGSSRSRTSAIRVYKGDILKSTCANYNSNAVAAIAETDANGTYYNPIFDGTGGEGGTGRNDPRTWTYVATKNTYVVCSYLTNIGITVTITRKTYQLHELQ